MVCFETVSSFHKAEVHAAFNALSVCAVLNFFACAPLSSFSNNCLFHGMLGPTCLSILRSSAAGSDRRWNASFPVGEIAYQCSTSYSEDLGMHCRKFNILIAKFCLNNKRIVNRYVHQIKNYAQIILNFLIDDQIGAFLSFDPRDQLHPCDNCTIWSRLDKERHPCLLNLFSS